MQVINVLKSGISDIDSIVKKDRRELHIVKETCNNKLVRLSRQAMKIVLIGRDPYARIYSAYVDKSYLGFKTNNSTLKRTNNCSFVEQPFIESFQEFLQNVFDDLNERKSNSHWTPVFILCNPCQSNIFLQIKLEELSKDMNYIYSRIGFSEDLQTQIKKLSTCRIDTLTGIASTIFQKHMDTKCKNSFLIAKRLWVSFQLQGYINEKSKFPGQLADFKYTNSSEVATKLFMKLISNEMSANPLSKSEANTQRYTNLVRAYRNVHSDSILKIQHYFKMDFLLFNYSMFPPQ
ncbi:uncharacterized protein LOC132758242 [Ruditapes philippinarum]|uniref:uncharacterized protein LOC132758242 n=1 Tax=Ruditapes philippinarum TaxID=129788 RepID=UPI00295B1049|nr:uncharacterized protein LOC132758242 [Ruditapes philippinarum]